MGGDFKHKSAWLFLKDKQKWKNPESTLARRNRLRVTDSEPEHFVEDALPWPPEGHRAEEGTSRKGLDLDMPAACPKVLNQGTTILTPKEERYGKKNDVQKAREGCVPQDWRQRKETEVLSESEGSTGGHWKSKINRQKSCVEDDLSQPWSYQDIRRKRRLRRSLKNLSAVAKTKRWAMPSWCHMFNSTLAGNAKIWFDDLSKESIDSYDDLKEAFLENYFQQKKCIKDPVEIYNIKKAVTFNQRIKAKQWKRPGKGGKKEGTSGEEKPLAIQMVQSWQRVAKQNITQTFSPESVISFPPLGEEDGTEGPMIIEAEMGGHFVHRMYVDGGSSSKILYEHCFNRFHPEVRSHMILVTMSLVTVSIQQNNMEAMSKENTGSAVYSSRNAKIPIGGRNGRITEQWDYSIRMHNGFRTRKEGRKELCGLLRCNLDIFTWKPADMTWVPRHIAEHMLNIREGCLLVRQKKRGQAHEKNKRIYEEVEKLVDTGIMKEVHYHSKLSNQIMVKKYDGSWRMCVDFKDLNKACPRWLSATRNRLEGRVPLRVPF
nr:reverse transcriptase domain-containing protein [Tanacetum cinerariifolium]